MAGNRVFVNAAGYYYTGNSPTSPSDQEKVLPSAQAISILNANGLMLPFDLEQAMVAAQNAAGNEDQDGFSA